MKVECENYHRLLQSVLIRNFKLHAVKSKQLSLLYVNLFQHLSDKQTIVQLWVKCTPERRRSVVCAALPEATQDFQLVEEPC